MRPHAEKVLRGEYDVPGLKFHGPPVVLDIGANVGAFAIWALRRWPGAKLICYEPHPLNFEMLKQNVPGAELHQIAIAPGSSTNGDLHLYDGKNNCGEASVTKGDEQADTYHVVPYIPPSLLPLCNVLKVDTEGCELYIIRAYLTKWARSGPRAVMFEWHRSSDRWEIAGILAASEFECVTDMMSRPDRGVMCWQRKE